MVSLGRLLPVPSERGMRSDEHLCGVDVDLAQSLLGIQAASGCPFRSWWWDAFQSVVNCIVLQFFGAANLSPLAVFWARRDISVALGLRTNNRMHGPNPRLRGRVAQGWREKEP